MSSKPVHSPLVDAAQALAEELERFASLVAAGVRERLDSARSLDRAGGALKQIPEVQDGIRERLLVLAEAFEGARRMQEELADRAQARALEITARVTELQALLAAQAALAEETREVNTFARDVAALDRSQPDAAEGLEQLASRIAGIVERASELSTRAREAGFPELSRTSDSLRQQILALKNRIVLGRN
jgi:hypothetical protein